MRTPTKLGWLLAAVIGATLTAFVLAGSSEEPTNAARKAVTPFLTDDESNNIAVFSAEKVVYS